MGSISQPLSAATVTWDGGANKDDWSGNNGPNGQRNWVIDANPVTNDDIVFAGSTRLTPNNNFANFAFTANSLTFASGAGAFTLGGNAINLGGAVTNNSTNLQTINMALGLNATITIAATSGDIAIGGVISGSNGITKTGNNTLTLSGANTYTGATNVNVGTLLVNGSIGSSSLTTVASGATIGGSGTTGALTVNTGGFINPGTTTGILSTGNYIQAGTYNAGITSTVAGTGYDQINVAGTVNITGGSLSANFSGSYSAGNLIFILLNDGTDAITGTYNGLAQNATVTTYGGFNWNISYTANSSTGLSTGGNDIALIAVVPEPDAALIGGLGILLLLLRRRRAGNGR